MSNQSIFLKEEQISPEVLELLTKSNELIQKAKDFLLTQGQVLDLSKHLTIKRYCEKYNLKSEATVVNWINRGIIPSEDVHTIPELNNLRMVKDRVYK